MEFRFKSSSILPDSREKNNSFTFCVLVIFLLKFLKNSRTKNMHTEYLTILERGVYQGLNCVGYNNEIYYSIFIEIYYSDMGGEPSAS